ncbi:soluble calcium-activated nucleotidase 1 [Zootermopsis nevadensis]|uniref:Apyrase n=1 Tax=Zootermopsis nevadensis TaxID=136037 RepID=A0A067QWF4_ZOONE|nr:soluble calcium-activated nucleotidase 1 [Zootermopsis nevadensis]KDR08953.1 Soluble calcium-activated nucleotidase 1 [Zootermopsis nevadensis]
MSQDSDGGEMMSLREWRQAIRTPVGNRTLRIQTQFVSLVAFIGLVVLFLVYTYAVDHHSNPSVEAVKNKSTVKLYMPIVTTSSHNNYNTTYPLTTPKRTSKGIQFRIGMVSDLDKESKSKTEEFMWLSYYKKGYLLWNPLSNSIKVSWDTGDPIVLKSRLGESGRGMELSELVVFNGKLYVLDDRTGIVYELLDDRVIPFVILNDGDGRMNKGFKSEWATVKQRKLFIGGLGKEWTTNTGEAVNTHPQWIKTVASTGEVEHHNWFHKYLSVRRVLGIEFPGYITHEAVVWSDVHDCWFFLPRRCSKERYNDVLDETRGCNVMITTDDTFTDIKVLRVGNIIPTHGFSSFKFIPGSSDQVIVALRSEEDKGATATYIIGFDITGKILLPETKVADKKYEGFEFI